MTVALAFVAGVLVGTVFSVAGLMVLGLRSGPGRHSDVHHRRGAS